MDKICLHAGHSLKNGRLLVSYIENLTVMILLSLSQWYPQEPSQRKQEVRRWPEPLMLVLN